MSAQENSGRDEAGLTVEALVVGAKAYLTRGAYLHGGEQFEGLYVEDDFWDAYQIYTGEKVSEGARGSFFSCSC